MKVLIEIDVDYPRVHDKILDCFDISITKEHLVKLLKLCDNNSLDYPDDIVSDIIYYFTNQRIPTYGDSEEYKNRFWKNVENKKEEFISFINS